MGLEDELDCSNAEYFRQFMEKEGYVDIVGNLPLRQLDRELRSLQGYKPYECDYITYVHQGKVDIYIDRVYFKGVGQ